MIENTISIDSKAVDTAENETSVAETAENSKAAQGNDWQGYEEKESGDVQNADTPDGEKTTESEGEKMKLTVYGEEYEMSFEEAKAAAQKGVAFEKVKAQLANARNNIHLRTLEQIAAAKGTTLAQLVSDIAHGEEHARLSKEYGDIYHVPANVIEESVNRLARLRENLRTGQIVQAADDWSSQLREFMEDNPGNRQIPDEVIETAKLTGNLALAYSDYNARQLAEELARTKAELEMLKAEKETAKGTTPSAKSVAAEGDYEDDSFRKMMRSTW